VVSGRWGTLAAESRTACIHTRGPGVKRSVASCAQGRTLRRAGCCSLGGTPRSTTRSRRSRRA
jgi:hypothetical protein